MTRSPHSALFTVVAVSIVLAVLLACKALGKPEEGSSCSKDGETSCANPTSILACQGGTWRSFPCTGQSGCSTKSGDKAVCDLSGNQAGEQCAKVDEGVTMCADPKSTVTCSSGKIVKLACKGKNGCKVGADNKVQCDQTISDPGAPCAEEGKSACTTDQKNQLSCKNGEWATEKACRGARGCWFESSTQKIYCDMSLSYIGDACFMDGDWACSLDGKTQLTCKNGKYSYGQRCSGRGGCSVEPGKLGSWVATCNH